MGGNYGREAMGGVVWEECGVGFFLGSFWGKRVDRYGVGMLIYALMLREGV